MASNYAPLYLERIMFQGQVLSIVRDDLFPFVYGGSKARKAFEYEAMLKKHGFNAIVTCGGVQSNHNRAVALMAARNGWKCHLCIQGAEERFLTEKGNALLCRLSGADYDCINPEETADSMDKAMRSMEDEGYMPYYIHGGGHDIPGGTCFVKAIEELKRQCDSVDYKPDYIFLASGTGSTQAGIVVGLEKVGWSDVRVVGISVARQYERGRRVITEFANMLGEHYGIKKDFANDIIFCTDYLCGGYEQSTSDMTDFLNLAMQETGLMFDTTYSGKGFYGMMDYVYKHYLQNKKLLFWHTGGLMNLMK